MPKSSTREVEQEKGHGKSGEMRPNHLAIPPEFGYDSQYWKEYVELAKDHDKEFITGLNAHLDSLLTFAGLFSSVNTGFIVLCLGLLDKTPSDKTNALIRILISQTTNVTREELDRASEERDLEPAGYLTSAFLSASLSCGLIAGMGAVLGKQWLSYYEKTGQTGTLDERAVKLQNKWTRIHSAHSSSPYPSLSKLHSSSSSSALSSTFTTLIPTSLLSSWF
ncbi:hypothetical protein FRC02_011471 [Tulasnella sp. 418]|nr:hypothetical protein FRC02_011471 [Tulasnella sp. 418]